MTAVGDRVRHARYGEGVVERSRHGGFEFFVVFDSLVRLWILSANLVSVESNERGRVARTRTEAEDVLDRIMGVQTQTVTMERPRKVSVLNPSPVLRKDRLAMEAFRLGIVPVESIREWTVGRDQEVESVFRWINDPASGSMVVEGAYGSGKSHILELLRAEALERNWAVCNVGIDPTDAPAGFPKRVYRHAMTSLRVPWEGQVYNLEALLNLLMEKPSGVIADHKVWSEVLRLWSLRPRRRPQLLAYLQGNPSVRRIKGLPNLLDHTTTANIYCYMLSGLSVWLTETLGISGLMLLVDEAEMSRTYHHAYQWSRGVNFFNGLAWMADDDDILENEAVVRRDCYRGAQSNLVYSGFHKWPYAYQIPSNFKVVFAFTPGYTRFFSHVHTENMVRLDTPSRELLLSLFDRLAEAYERLYDVPANSQNRRECARALIDAYGYSFRMLIKGFVEVLDHGRFYPQTASEELLAHVSGSI
jgi:hypothetical protein